MPIKPDDFHCKRCRKVVRYAKMQMGNGRYQGASFDARQVKGAGWSLVEEEVDGVATGDWIATYVKVGERDPDALGWRKHDCQVPRAG